MQPYRSLLRAKPLLGSHDSAPYLLALGHNPNSKEGLSSSSNTHLGVIAVTSGMVQESYFQRLTHSGINNMTPPPTDPVICRTLRNLHQLLCGLLLLLMIPTATPASAEENLHIYQLMLGAGIDGANPEWRLELASQLRENFQMLLHCVPAVSPQEQDWLAQEEARIVNIEGVNSMIDATMRLHATSEYRCHSVRNQLQSQIDTLDGILEGTRLSMTMWLAVAIAMSDDSFFDDLQELDRKHVIRLPEGVLGPPIRKGGSRISRIISDNIIEHIVYPYMAVLEIRELGSRDADSNSR